MTTQADWKEDFIPHRHLGWKANLVRLFWAALLPLMLSAGTSVFLYQAQSRMQAENAQIEFMRTERSKVYAEYLEASVAYQNSLNAYAQIIPVWDKDPHAPVDRTAAGPIFQKALDERQNYVNKTVRVNLLQCNSAMDEHSALNAKLFKTHDRMGGSIDNTSEGSDHRWTNQYMYRYLVGTGQDDLDDDGEPDSFNTEMTELRNQYVNAVRNDFHERGACQD